MLFKFPLMALQYPMFGSASAWWTLGIEWWLYMAFGWLVLKQRDWLYYIGLAFLMIVPLRYTIFDGVGSGLSVVWLVACCAVFVMGGLSRYLSQRKAAVACVLFGILACARYKLAMDSYDFLAAIYMGCAFISGLVCFQQAQVNPGPRLKKRAEQLAGYSFTLFLIHYSVLYFIVTLFGDGWFMFLVGVLISNVLAYLIAQCSEIHHRRISAFLCHQLKRRIRAPEAV